METTKSYKKYIRLYGPHFTKDLATFAASLMWDDKKESPSYTKQQIQDMLKRHNIQLENDDMYDSVFVACMGKADFLGKSVPNDDLHLCLYIKDVIDDPDGYDGQPFYRWLTDMERTGTHVDWSEFV